MKKLAGSILILVLIVLFSFAMGAEAKALVITGNTGIFVYDGQEHEVTGFDASHNAFTYVGHTQAKGTDVGTYDMGLELDDFIVSSNEIIEITDGWMMITRRPVTVIITGHSDAVDYDGLEHIVTGYDIAIDDELYTVNDFSFNGEASVSGTEVNTYSMGLDESDFENQNYNFDVTFIVEDGSLTIQESEYVASGTWGVDDANLTWTLDSDGLLTIYGTGAMDDFEQDFEGTNAWQVYRNEIRTVTIKSGITSIGKYAFFLCENITNVSIPNTVISIGQGAFSDCEGLIQVVIPNSVTVINSYAFSGCRSLTSITLPTNISQIGSYAISNCDILTEITLPATITYMGEWPFSGCDELSDVYYMGTKSQWNQICEMGFNQPAATVHCSDGDIPFYAYGTCGDNATWTIDSDYILTITGTGTLERGSWDGYLAKIQEIVISEGITEIGDYLLRFCSSATSVSIPNSVTRIGIQAFNLFESLSSIVIPENVVTIDESAFSFCTSLSEITFMGSPSSIKRSAFSGCTSLQEVHISNIEAWLSIDFSNNLSNPCNYAHHLFIGGQELTDITIPNGTTAIKPFTFYNCSNLNSVSIPESVTSIGRLSFYGCENLTDITLPTGISNLEVSTFNGCSSLTEIIVPENVVSLGNYAFNNCTNLAAVTLPAGLNSIGNNAFNNCTALTDVYYAGNEEDWAAIEVGSNNEPLNNATIHYNYQPSEQPEIIDSGTCGENLTWTLDSEGVLKISGTGEMANYSYYSTPWIEFCESIRSIRIESNVTSIGKYAFIYCSNLLSVSLPDSLTSVGSAAFEECSSLESIVLPNGVTNIGEGAFQHCSSLRDIVIPDGVTALWNGVFYNCSSLTSLVIPSSVTRISYLAFSDCTSLIEITIPKNVTYIGNAAFANCSALTSILVDDDNAQYASVSGVLFDKSIQIILACPGGMAGTYAIPASVTRIEDSAFSGCGSLTGIEIPDGVNYIGSYAFSNCGQLSNITLPANINHISESCFEYCSSLTSISIPEGVTGIGDYAFCCCTSLMNITIPESVTSIGEYAFVACSSLTEFILPGNVTTLRNGIFKECESLTSIILPFGVTSIGEWAFSECFRLKGITIPESLTNVGEYAFFFSSITDIYYKGSYEQWKAIHISDENDCLLDAFIHFIGVPPFDAILNLPSNLTTIESEAFVNLPGVDAICIPATVTSIAPDAFDPAVFLIVPNEQWAQWAEDNGNNWLLGEVETIATH